MTTTHFVITGTWTCDQPDILCDDADLDGGRVLCDGIGIAVPDTMNVSGVNLRLSPSRPEITYDRPGVYRRPK